LAAKNGANIGHTHADIESNVSPDKPNPKMEISRNAWTNYKALYRYSRTARYNGFKTAGSFDRIMEIDHNSALQCLNAFKGYIKGQGVPV